MNLLPGLDLFSVFLLNITPPVVYRSLFKFRLASIATPPISSVSLSIFLFSFLQPLSSLQRLFLGLYPALLYADGNADVWLACSAVPDRSAPPPTLRPHQDLFLPCSPLSWLAPVAHSYVPLFPCFVLPFMSCPLPNPLPFAAVLPFPLSRFDHASFLASLGSCATQVLSVTRQQLQLSRGVSTKSRFLLVSGMSAVDVFKKLRASVETDMLPVSTPVGGIPTVGPGADDAGPAATAGAASSVARRQWEMGEDLDDLAAPPSIKQQTFRN
eukprot:1972827-Pleurochrysis_carterae.AAC.3